MRGAGSQVQVALFLCVGEEVEAPSVALTEPAEVLRGPLALGRRQDSEMELAGPAVRAAQWGGACSAWPGVAGGGGCTRLWGGG